MKKRILLPLLLSIPFLLIAQHASPMAAVDSNSSLVSQLAQLLPMGINPYATVFLTSILSKMGIHNDFVGTNPFFDNWLILGIFGILFLFTALVGTVFKTNKATAVIGLADNYLSNHAAIFINIIVMIAPAIFTQTAEHPAVQEAGIFSIGLQTILVLIVSVYFLMVVTTVRFFIDILIFLSPIPFIDSILEVAKIVVTVLFVLISVFYPTFSVILAVITFLIALSMYRKSVRMVNKTSYLFIHPVLQLFKKKTTLLERNNTFAIRVYCATKTKKFKKGTIATLTEKSNTFVLTKKRFFVNTIEEVIDINDLSITEGKLSSKIKNGDDSFTLLLNRSYRKHLESIANTLGIHFESKQKTTATEKKTALIGSVKNMFDKNDIEELKLID
ncbi:hypothetical protein [Tenacibaculum sp. M341]|uniref:hypothetical protein n=1 Tax=Tenacibaculum sp. M341 TaxID=2530339 RepID=UPI001047D588|nr:hypothetical protein [Tenacibaculum sp. M341]TCI91352.1 hypothetical protein EYW44_10370 [Tenacibaculum sp. M341]